MKFFLGVRTTDFTAGVYLPQYMYTLDILIVTGLLGCKTSKVPIEQNHTLQHNNSDLLSDTDCSIYQTIVWRLLYLTITRPKFFYSIQVLSQFLAKPRLDHLHAAYKVLRYLKGSLGQGLFYSANSKSVLTAYSDSDWGGCHTTRHSLTSHRVQFGSSIISWKCKNQHTVSKSSAKAEYRAMSNTCCELV